MTAKHVGLIFAASLFGMVGCMADTDEPELTDIKQQEEETGDLRDYTGAGVGGALGGVGGALIGNTFFPGEWWARLAFGGYFGSMLSRYGYEHWQLGQLWDHLPGGPYFLHGPVQEQGGDTSSAVNGHGQYSQDQGSLYNGGYYPSGTAGASTLGSFGTTGSGIGSGFGTAGGGLDGDD